MGGDDVCHRGLPDMTSEERDEGAKKLTTTVAGSLVVVSCVGTAIAEATYRLGATSKAAAKIATLGGLDLGWLYLGIYAVTRTVGLVNMYPMIYKARVMRSKSGNLRANMCDPPRAVCAPAILDARARARQVSVQAGGQELERRRDRARRRG